MAIKAKKIDCHTHFFPIKFLKEMQKRTSDPILRPDPAYPHLAFCKKGLAFSHVQPPHMDIKLRLRDMDKYGMDLQALSLTCPAVDVPEPALSIKLAKIVNDEFARIQEKHSNRFVGLATLPLQSMDKALDELDRAIKDLGLRGVCVMSNIGGKRIYAHEFWPLYERATKLDVPIFIHPNFPLDLEATTEALTAVFGFIVDTTISITMLILGGVLEKYPTLKLVIPHLGSMVPYFQERIDTMYAPGIYKTADVPDWYIRGKSRFPNITKLPSEYFKLVYMDTVSFYPPALNCAYAMAGPDHLLLGSDYPHFPLGDLNKAIKSIAEMDWPEQDKQKVYGFNAARILKIE